MTIRHTMSTRISLSAEKPNSIKKSKQTSDHASEANVHQQTNIETIQDVVLIWLNSSIDDNDNDYQNTLTQLRRVVNTVYTYTENDKCIDFLTDISNVQVFLIISGTSSQEIVPAIHDILQLHKIFIFCQNKAINKEWIRRWHKVHDVFAEILSLYEALQQTTQQYEQNAMPISFISTDDNVCNTKLEQLDPSFMYTQILKEILLVINFEDKHIQEFTTYCRERFADNEHTLNRIEEFKCDYRDKTPIWWYTGESFLYPLLNRTLRLMDVNIIIKIGFFIKDLYHHIEQLYSAQLSASNSKESFTVYRGQGVSTTDFEKMRKTKGGLMSFNSFLSTSKNRDVSFAFAESNTSNPNSVGVLFVMTIDSSQSTASFASIGDVGYYGNAEAEVLFSMHTVFRICEIKSMDKDQRLFQVNLALTSDNDKDLQRLTDHIREEIPPENNGWYRLGSVLLLLGESVKAQQLYEVILEQTNNDGEKSLIFNQLGRAKNHQGEYKEAIMFYEKSIEIEQRMHPVDHRNLANCYNNIGSSYSETSEYEKALQYFEKALLIKQQLHGPIHPSLGVSYHNIATMYDATGDYTKALTYFEKALSNREEFLPPNHPDLSSSYTNIGRIYFNIGQNSKALSSYEKALAIQQSSLPATHPSLGTSYNNMGTVYIKMNEYSKALSFFEKSLDIQQHLLPPDHPSFAFLYNNIGLVYDEMGECLKALCSYETALKIWQQSLPANHPDLAICFNNIGLVHYSMENDSKALLYYEKALMIQQSSLSPMHSSLGASYNNIGTVYDRMGEYLTALSFYEKAFEIRQNSLPSNHPDLADSYNNIGSVYFNIDNYSKALSCHEKALEIQKKSLPPNESNLADTYDYIGAVYISMDEYCQALSSYEKALELRLQSLPPNHPALGASYNNLGAVYQEMANFSKAHLFYERAVNIGQHSLPSNHPDLETYKQNLEDVKQML